MKASVPGPGDASSSPQNRLCGTGTPRPLSWAACLLQLVTQPLKAWPSQLTWGQPTASFLTETAAQLGLSPCPPRCPLSPPTGAEPRTQACPRSAPTPGREGVGGVRVTSGWVFTSSGNLTLGEQKHKPLLGSRPR